MAICAGSSTTATASTTPPGVRGFGGPNQGNQIGRGFLDFRHIVGVGGGAFLAVRDNGDLLWFRYTGNGEQDPSGTQGFAENNSGNQIGRGFQTVRHLFGGVTDRPGLEGQTAPARVFFFVDENGDLRWLRYSGDGEQDPTGSMGFDGANQGNQIGRGFSASTIETAQPPGSPVERLQSAIEAANRRWEALPEGERRPDHQPESLPAPEPLAVLCAQYKASAFIMHDEAQQRRPERFRSTGGGGHRTRSRVRRVRPHRLPRTGRLTRAAVTMLRAPVDPSAREEDD